MTWKLFVVLWLLGPAAQAAEPAWLSRFEAWRYGWEVFFVQPTGALNAFSRSYGIGGALVSERDLGVRNQLQTVFSYTHYMARSASGIPTAPYSRAQLQAVGSMVNVVHHFRPEANRAPFLLVGVGFRNFWGSADLPDDAAPPGAGRNPVMGEQRYSLGTGIKLAYQLGVGFDFNPRWRATLRCQMSRSMGHTLPSLELGTGMRF
jgi:hypothetical protein